MHVKMTFYYCHICLLLTFLEDHVKIYMHDPCYLTILSLKPLLLNAVSYQTQSLQIHFGYIMSSKVFYSLTLERLLQYYGVVSMFVNKCYRYYLAGSQALSLNPIQPELFETLQAGEHATCQFLDVHPSLIVCLVILELNCFTEWLTREA